MKSNTIRKFFAPLAMAAAGLVLSAGAQAVTIEMDILHSGDQYSFVREGALPNPPGSEDDYLRFDAGQSIVLDLTGTTVSLSGGAQSLSLSSINGAFATFDILTLSLDLNDVDGFLSGSMDYALDGMAGVFSFLNDNYGNSPFNSSTFDGSTLGLFLWGGDDANDLGIDIGMSGTIPEPGVLFLISIGLISVAVARRRRS